MDELEISGRQYLSAKRAARNHRYHSDYIGQLIRSKKVIGQKVGRSWYVDAESLDAYLKGEPQPTVAIAEEPAPAAVEAPTQGAPVVINRTPQMTPVAPAPTIAPQPVQPIEAPRVVPIARTQPVAAIEEKKIEPAPRAIYTPAPTGLRYVPDDEPIASVQTMQDFVPPQEEAVVTQEAPIVRRKARAGMPIALTLVGVFAFSIALGASYLVASQTTVVGERASASLHLSLPQ